jgi:hypothetical protein
LKCRTVFRGPDFVSGLPPNGGISHLFPKRLRGSNGRRLDAMDLLIKEIEKIKLASEC